MQAPSKIHTGRALSPPLSHFITFSCLFAKAGYRNRLRCQGCALVTPFSCIDAALLAPFAPKLRPAERRESGLSISTFTLTAFTPCSDLSVACFLHRCTIAVFKQADLLHVLDYSNSVLGDSVDRCPLRLTLALLFQTETFGGQLEAEVSDSNIAPTRQPLHKAWDAQLSGNAISECQLNSWLSGESSNVVCVSLTPKSARSQLYRPFHRHIFNYITFV
jgi:hypothetical protein